MKTIYWLWWSAVLTVTLCGQSPGEAPRGAPNPELHGWLHQSDSLLHSNEFEPALLMAQAAAKMARETKTWPEWSQAVLYLLEALYFSNRYTEITATLPALEQQAKAVIHPDSSFWGSYFNIAGAVCNETGDYEAALRFGLREIAFFEKKNSPADLAVAANNVGTYYRNRGDYDRALEYTQSALQAYTSDPQSDPADVAWTLGNLSKIQYRKKDFLQAIDYAERTLALLKKHFPRDRADEYVSAYNDLAIACTEVKSYDRAQEALQAALDWHRRAGGEEGGPIEFTWHNLGHLYRMTGRYAEAAGYLQKAIARYPATHPNYSKACRHMGFVVQRQGDLRGALAWQQRALTALAGSFPDRENMLANPPARGVSAYLDFLFALRDKAETLDLLAQRERDPALLEASLNTYDLAAALLDSMRLEYQEGSQQFWNEEAHPILESAIDAALRLYRQNGRSSCLEQAFRYAEHSKALLLAEALRASAAIQKAGIPDSLLQVEKQLKIDISFYKKQIFQEQQRPAPDAARVLRWQSEILRRRRAGEALLERFKDDYPEYFQIKYQQPGLDIAALRAALPANTGLLEYFRGDRWIFVFYLDHHGAQATRFTPDSLYSAALDRLFNDLRDRDRATEQGRSAAAVTQFAADAAALFEALVAPVVEKLPGQLLIVPDGRLAYLPFEVLLTKPATGAASYAELPYLIEQCEVRYEYSARLAVEPAPRRQAASHFAGYAPMYDGTWSAALRRGEPMSCREAEPADFAPLRNNQAEVKAIVQQVGGQAFLGEQATEAQFRSHAHEAQVVHLAMHGFLNDCDPLYSGLVFSAPAPGEQTSGAPDDGFLHAYEIYNMRLNADLAVLSACNTGRGRLVKGEGVISLARAFKYAGCANIVMSLWQADDQSTAQIMQDFYKNLDKGLDKGAAIRQAKLNYLKSNTRNHPFFWGAFVLIGAPHPPSIPWLTYAGAALVAAGGFIFWRRWRQSDQSDQSWNR